MMQILSLAYYRLQSHSVVDYMLLPVPYNQIIGLSLIRFMRVRWKRDSERKREKESEVNNERKKGREKGRRKIGVL